MVMSWEDLYDGMECKTIINGYPIPAIVEYNNFGEGYKYYLKIELSNRLIFQELKDLNQING